MSDNDQKPTPGFEDHHHVKAQPFTVDKAHQAPREVKDTVWDIIQGKLKTTEIEAPIPRGNQRVEVPFEYVNACAFFAAKALLRRGCTRGFTVKRNPDRPEFELRWDRPMAHLLPEGSSIARAHAQETDCLTAFVQSRAPEHVGVEAVDLFLRKLQDAEAR
jgi:hypothetical protein